MPKKKETKQNEKPKIDNNAENQETTNQKLGWVQILLLLGKPLWDAQKKKWRVLNGYQSVLGNSNNQMFFGKILLKNNYMWIFLKNRR